MSGDFLATRMQNNNKIKKIQKINLIKILKEENKM